MALSLPGTGHAGSQRLANFTMGEADVLRRAMGKKKASEIMAMRDKFVQGAARNGIDESLAGHLFDIMESFAGYGFNKSHSATYALISYQTAYLKAHYRLNLCVLFSAVSLSTRTGWFSISKTVKRWGYLSCRPTSTRALKTSRWGRMVSVRPGCHQECGNKCRQGYRRGSAAR